MKKRNDESHACDVQGMSDKICLRYREAVALCVDILDSLLIQMIFRPIFTSVDPFPFEIIVWVANYQTGTLWDMHKI